jgi:monoamine oxidase
VHDLNLYADTGVNWRIVQGYGALVAGFGANLPVRLGCEVFLIDHSGARLAVETSLGRFSADAVIVTVPTSILALKS